MLTAQTSNTPNTTKQTTRMEGSSSMEYIMDPKVLLLQHKLALVMGPEHCPIYDTINAVHPNALEEPWLDDMSGPSYKFISKHIVPWG